MRVRIEKDQPAVMAGFFSFVRIENIEIFCAESKRKKLRNKFLSGARVVSKRGERFREIQKNTLPKCPRRCRNICHVK